MTWPKVQFDNVRKHYQMRQVTVKALRGVAVAQTCSLLYRRIAFCGRREACRVLGPSTARRLQIGDTADYKSALQNVGAALECREFGDATVAVLQF